VLKIVVLLYIYVETVMNRKLIWNLLLSRLINFMRPW